MKYSKLVLSKEFKSSSLTSKVYNLPSRSRIKDFYSTLNFTLLLSETGDLWEIGSFIRNNPNENDYHQLNLKITISQIACNGQCTLLLSNAGRVYGWGISKTGILGTISILSNPVLLKTFELKKINKIYITNAYAAAIDDQGSSFLWGTFVYTNIDKDICQLTLYKDFIVKDICCNDHFTCVCTDGGFVYYIGRLGVHSKTEVWSLVSFPALEELCAVQIAIGLNFIAVLTDAHEVFIFDGCQMLSLLPFIDGIFKIFATDEYLVGVDSRTVHVWKESIEDPEKFNKNYCPLKNWRGKVYEIQDGNEICTGKGISKGYGIVYNASQPGDVNQKRLKTFPSGWNRGFFTRIIENDSPNSLFLYKVLNGLIRSKLKQRFLELKNSSKGQSLLKKLINYTLLPNTLINICNKYNRRNMMIGWTCINQELKLQDYIALETVKLARLNNKIKVNAAGALFKTLSGVLARNLKRFARESFEKIEEVSFLCKRRLDKIRSVFNVLRRFNLRNFMHLWKGIAEKWGYTILKFVNIVKNSKFFIVQDAYRCINSFSDYKRYKTHSKHNKLRDVFKIISRKYSRKRFKTWKKNFLKQKAILQRELQNAQISIKLGCKYLFPILLSHIHVYWSIFKSNSLDRIKIKYKHFCLFIVYFIKKKISGYGLFNKLSVTPDSSSNYSNMFQSPEILNLSGVSCLGNSYGKNLNFSINSPGIPKLLLNFSPKSRVSSSQSTTRPPWKPASGSSFIVNTPKASKKPKSNTTKCFRSLNPLSQTSKAKKPPKTQPKDNNIKLTLGLNAFKRFKAKLDFRLKFFGFKILKFFDLRY
jgi:hypothetical protein